MLPAPTASGALLCPQPASCAEILGQQAAAVVRSKPGARDGEQMFYNSTWCGGNGPGPQTSSFLAGTVPVASLLQGGVDGPCVHLIF